MQRNGAAQRAGERRDRDRGRTAHDRQEQHVATSESKTSDVGDAGNELVVETDDQNHRPARHARNEHRQTHEHSADARADARQRGRWFGGSVRRLPGVRTIRVRGVQVVDGSVRTGSLRFHDG